MRVSVIFATTRPCGAAGSGVGRSPTPPPAQLPNLRVPTVNTAGACPGKTVLPPLFYHLYHYCVLWIDWHESSRKVDWHIVFMISISRKGNDLYDASLLPLCSIYDILSYSILGSIPIVVTFANSTAGLVYPAPSQAVNPFMRFPMMASPTPYICFFTDLQDRFKLVRSQEAYSVLESNCSRKG